MGKNYRSELVGLFGNPVDENPTGVVEEAAFSEKGLSFRYINFKVDKDGLEIAVRALRALNMRGINLTIPHKVAVIPYLDELSPAAEIIGAVNVIVNNDGSLWGENTDGKGFLTSLLSEGVSPENKNITILGAGGAARAIGVECALAGAKKIVIVNRGYERGKVLEELINKRTKAAAEFHVWDKNYSVPEDTDILVNATSVGLYPNTNQRPDIKYETFKENMIVCDVIFNDPNSLFLKEAEKIGAKTINGLGMLVNQAAVNFKLWTGVDAPIDVMNKTLRREFNLE